MIRSFIVLIITVIALRIGRWIFDILTQIIDIQLSLYTFLLETNSKLTSTIHEIENSIVSLQGRVGGIFGSSSAGAKPIVDDYTYRIDEKINQMTVQRYRVARGVAFFSSIIVWHLLFSMIYRIRSVFGQVVSFIQGQDKA